MLTAGHEAITVFERLLSRHPDQRLAELCKDEKRALLTLDVDFANTLLYPPTEYFGLVVLRLASQDKPHVLAVALGCWGSSTTRAAGSSPSR